MSLGRPLIQEMGGNESTQSKQKRHSNLVLSESALTRQTYGQSEAGERAELRSEDGPCEVRYDNALGKIGSFQKLKL